MSDIDVDRARRLLRSPIESDRRRALDMIAQSGDLGVLTDVMEAMKRETNRDLKRQGEALLRARSADAAHVLWQQMRSGQFDPQNPFAGLSGQAVSRSAVVFPAAPEPSAALSLAQVASLMFLSLLSLVIGAGLALVPFNHMAQTIIPDVLQRVHASETPLQLDPVYQALIDISRFDSSEVVLMGVVGAVVFETTVALLTVLLVITGRVLGGSGPLLPELPGLMASALGTLSSAGVFIMYVVTAAMQNPVIETLHDGQRLLTLGEPPLEMALWFGFFILVAFFNLVRQMRAAHRVSTARALIGAIAAQAIFWGTAAYLFYAIAETL
ncbi:MAG: hypothetical protein SNJ80_08540 [Anaerolinea sp.]